MTRLRLLRTLLSALLATLLGLPLAATVAAAQTPDSALAVRAGGQTLFRVNVDGGSLFGGSYDGGLSGGIPAEGAGTRMLWYPQKAAFRAGYVNGTQWDDANVGIYSFAAGENVRANGSNGVAFGLRSVAASVAAFAVGEDNTANGAASVALGYHAHTNARQGSFVFSDRSSVDTVRAGVNHSASWRVNGGFRIFTSSNLSTGVTIQSGAATSNWGQSDAVISTSTGAYLSTAGVWTNTSDVRRKHRFADLSGEDVLSRLRALPIRSWSYRAEGDAVRHVGPTAQDFQAAFGFGGDSLTISTVDADGVNMAAVKALEARTASQAAELATLRARNRELDAARVAADARLAAAEERLARLEALLRQQAPAPR